MPHRLSLLRRVGELRRTYTGEHDTSLWPTVTTGMTTLTTMERGALYDTLERGFETRLLGDVDDYPPVTERLRRAVLPDATDAAQQQLETAVLFALGRSVSYRPPQLVRVGRDGGCVIVRPGVAEGEAVLHLPAVTAAPMVAALLPHGVDDGVRGLAGLRTRVCRRHVRLYLRDSAPSVSVALANISLRQWSAILAFAREVTGHEWPVTFDDPLSGQERAAIAAGRVPGLVSLGSALFRRLRVLGMTSQLAVGADGPTGIRVEWAGGRTAAQVAAALVHPLAGLPGERFTATRCAANSVTVTIAGVRGAATARIVLHRAPVTTPPPFKRIDATAAWAEFNRVMEVWTPAPPRPAVLAR